MKFFQKSSIPLLILGTGILLFVLGLSAVSSLTEKTGSELIDSYFQQVSLNQAESEILVTSAGHKLNLQFTGYRSIGGLFAGENLVLKLIESDNQTQLLEVKNFTQPEWQEEFPPANREIIQIIIPVTTKLPDTAQIGKQIEGVFSGVINYPIEQDNSIITKRENIDHQFNIRVLGEEEMLKHVRQRPIVIMIVSFSLSLILIPLGIRAEFFGRKKQPLT